MGWTETSAIHRKANGQADVKAELDAIYTWADNIHKSKVLKSQIVRGEFHKSVYYAAVERKEQPYHAAMRNDGTDGREVFCAVVLIEDATELGFDFMYKDMDEFAGPIEQHCPSSILICSPRRTANGRTSGAASAVRTLRTRHSARSSRSFPLEAESS